ncbi:MAG TPA: hypothetical protein VGD43_01465 [Micromonospora sp.]
MTVDIPPRLPALIDLYTGVPERAVEFLPPTWTRALSDWPAEAEVLVDDRWSEPADGPGRRLVGREDLHRLLDATDLDDALATRRAFVLMMAWAGGTAPSGYRFTPRALTAWDAAPALARAALLCRRGDLARAYRTFKLPGVGRAFFTRWFAVAGRAPGRSWQPLILDDKIFRSLNTTLKVSTLDWVSTRDRAMRYAGYVDRLHLWSDQLRDTGVDCPADRIAWILHRHNGGGAHRQS